LRGESPFTTSALEEVYRLTNGVPRLINSICDHTLGVGFRRQQTKLGGDAVLEAAEEMGWEQPVPVVQERNANLPAGFAKTAS
jgi:hypothetical protein